MNSTRSIKQIVEPQYVIEGAGVLLQRSLAPSRENPLDPFLLFDHFAFDNPSGKIGGFPMHPHRGIETVTDMLKGSVQHRDSLGNAGKITPGDVQWMTSGRGILHEEMPQRDPEGVVRGFQLWVNLPAELKMSAPRYQEVTAQMIPEVNQDGAKVRVVAGSLDGATGPVTEIAIQPTYLDVTVEANRTFSIPIPIGHTALAYVMEGEGVFGDDEIVSAMRMVVFGNGDHVRAQGTQASSVRFLLISGQPIGEPIVPYGPFVMNTFEQIQQTLVDLREGTFIQN
jgi:redox-sensitive bicupin YhaK (pirin superfamily)